MIKKSAPKANVNLLIKSSLPRSFLWPNKSELPPEIIWDAPSALVLCNKTIAINKIEIIINKVFIMSPHLLVNNLAYFSKKYKCYLSISSSILISSLYLQILSPLDILPVLIKSVPSPTAREAISVSSVSPLLWDIIVL